MRTGAKIGIGDAGGESVVPISGDGELGNRFEERRVGRATNRCYAFAPHWACKSGRCAELDLSWG
jgi:hypothetical protein